jgi:hypothetical protein
MIRRRCSVRLWEASDLAQPLVGSIGARGFDTDVADAKWRWSNRCCQCRAAWAGHDPSRCERSSTQSST